MMRFNIVGTADDKGARVLPCRIQRSESGDTDIRCNLATHEDFQETIRLARHRGADLLESLDLSGPAQSLRSCGFEFHVDAPFFVGALEQGSYGLPLAIAFVCEALGIECGNGGLVGTGVLPRDDPDGVALVDGASLRSKIRACGEVRLHLLCPPGQLQNEQHASSLPKDTPLFWAMWLLGGTNLIRVATEQTSDDGVACQMLAMYCRAHVEVGLFPHDLAALEPLFRRLIRGDNREARLFAVLSLADLTQATTLPSESEEVLHCIVEQSCETREFDEALATVMKEVLAFGIAQSHRGAFRAVAYLLHAIAMLYSDQRLLDRLSPIGAFFRDIVDKANPARPDLPETLVVYVLRECGIRLNLFNVAGVQGVTSQLLEAPISRELLVKHDDKASLAGIEYTLKLEEPFELFDFGRAHSASDGTVTKIDLNCFGVSIHWIDGVGIFPPSIDTLHFVGDIAGPMSEDNACHLVDIGSGTGVLGIVAAKCNPRVESVDFIDIYPLAGDFCHANVCVNWTNHRMPERQARDELSFPSLASMMEVEERGHTVSMRIHSAPAETLLKPLAAKRPDGKFSLAIAAPPYVPIYGSLPISLWQATAGTGLLRWLVENGGDFTDRLLISFGEIARPEFDSALGVAKNRWNVRAECLGRHVVAFRIPGLINLLEAEDRYPGWREKLLAGPLASVCCTDDDDGFTRWRASAPKAFQEWHDSRRDSEETLPHFLHVTNSYLLDFK